EIHARQLEASAVLTVRDSAGGIPAAALPKIFDELFTTKDPTRGTGLGLSIARHLVEQSFAGTLTVETEAGVGSCFAITLPAARDGGVRSRTPPLDRRRLHSYGPRAPLARSQRAHSRRYFRCPLRRPGCARGLTCCASPPSWAAWRSV